MKTLALSILVGLLAAPASALELMIKNVRTPASTVTANIEVRDVLPDRFKRLIDDGGVLHLRVEAELWESRPVWDRLRYSAISRVVLIGPSVSGGANSVTESVASAWECST